MTINKLIVGAKGSPSNSRGSDVASAINALIDEYDLKGLPTGSATLDGSGKVPSSQLPGALSSIKEYSSIANFPATGETEIVYIALDTNLTYRWSGSQYTEISPSIALGTTSSTAYRGDLGNLAYVHSQSSGNPHGTTASDLNLGNVDNTSDIDKPISSATQTALDDKVDNSQVLTAVPAGAVFTDTTYVSSDFDHNSLTNYLPEEHIDWSVSQVANIHPDNYTAGGGGGAVDSVFGRTGTVIAQASDYSSFYATATHEHTKADITDFNEADYATATQGALADSALQSGDNISELVNDAGFITAAQVPADAISSVDGRTGSVTLTDLYATAAQGALADNAIPRDGDTGLTGDFTTSGNIRATEFHIGNAGSEFKADSTSVTLQNNPLKTHRFIFSAGDQTLVGINAGAANTESAEDVTIQRYGSADATVTLDSPTFSMGSTVIIHNVQENSGTVTITTTAGNIYIPNATSGSTHTFTGKGTVKLIRYQGNGNNWMVASITG